MLLYILITMILILYLIDKWIHRGRRGMLVNKIPGSKLLPVFGNGLDILHGSAGLFSHMRSLANKYKNISKMVLFYEIGVNIYDPEDIEILLSSTKYIAKGNVYNLIRPWLNDGLLTTTGERWMMHRKILTPAFHFSILRQFCTVFFEQSERLVKKLRSEVGNDTEIMPFITEFALNSISETAMGTNLDSVQGDVKTYKNAIYTLGKLIINRFTKVWLYPDILYNLTSDGRLYKKALTTLQNFTTHVINERRKERNSYGNKFVINKYFEGDCGTKTRLAMLDLLLTAEEEGTIDAVGIREEVDTFMFEGHDTTMTAIIFCLMLLANHQDIQNLIVEELNEIFIDKDDPVTMEKLNQMNFLERCIKESLRLYPSVPYIGRQLTEDLQLKNYLIPAGVSCNVNIYDIHRDQRLFPNPDKFDPNRFLPENAISRHPYAYIPFSAGPRNCIGQKFAILEEKAAVSSILRNFKLDPVTRPEDIIFMADMVLRSRDPVKIKFTPRKI